jgi:AcrR family transcriptional regulator
MAHDTKDRILDVAETRFADHGFVATSLRDITSDAGVNIAAVNYHFGSKEALLAAVLERRIAPVNRERLELLDEAEAAANGGAADLEALVRALLAPPFRRRLVVEGGAVKFLQLAGRIHSEPHAQARAIFLAQFGEVIRRFVPAFRKALPRVPEEEVSWRLLFIMGAMAHTMMSTHMFDVLGCRQPSDTEELLEALVQFAVAGIKTPATVRQPSRSGAVA